MTESSAAVTESAAVKLLFSNRKSTFEARITIPRARIIAADPTGDTLIGAKVLRWAGQTDEIIVENPDDVIHDMVLEEVREVEERGTQ